jgi:hypothetical protein
MRASIASWVDVADALWRAGVSRTAVSIALAERCSRDAELFRSTDKTWLAICECETRQNFNASLGWTADKPITAIITRGAWSFGSHFTLSTDT